MNSEDHVVPEIKGVFRKNRGVCHKNTRTNLKELLVAKDGTA